MTNKEARKAWDTVIRIYKEGDNPKVTAEKIKKELGEEAALEIFATVAKIKQHDGRIYGRNRERMDQIQVPAENVKREFGNAMIYSGLDEIHTAHINQIISYL